MIYEKRITFEYGEPVLNVIDSTFLYDTACTTYEPVNLYDENKKYHYLISFGYRNDKTFLISADDLESALTMLIDYLKENDKSMLFTDKELQELKQDAINDGVSFEDYMVDFIYCDGEYVNSYNYFIELLDKNLKVID